MSKAPKKTAAKVAAKVAAKRQDGPIAATSSVTHQLGGTQVRPVETESADPAQDAAKMSDEDFNATLEGLNQMERKAAVDARNLAIRGPEAKAGMDPDPPTWHEVPEAAEHPAYSIQRQVRDLEMALSKVAGFHDTGVQMTLDRLKRGVNDAIDHLHGPVKASKG